MSESEKGKERAPRDEGRDEGVPEPADRADVHVTQNRCPFCRDDVRADDAASMVCRRCLARHHTACWIEAGRCSACAATEGLTPAPPSVSPDVKLLALSVAIALLIVVGLVLNMHRSDDGLAVPNDLPAAYFVDTQGQAPSMIATPNGVTVTLRRGEHSGVVVFDRQRLSGGAEFFYRLPDDAAWRTGETVDVNGTWRVQVGALDVEWAPCSPGRGWLLPTEDTQVVLTLPAR